MHGAESTGQENAAYLYRAKSAGQCRRMRGNHDATNGTEDGQTTSRSEGRNALYSREASGTSPCSNASTADGVRTHVWGASLFGDAVRDSKVATESTERETRGRLGGTKTHTPAEGITTFNQG